MEFNVSVAPWVKELQNYVFEIKRQPDDLKRIVKAADVSKLSYEDKALLFNLFDPTSKLTHETFEREFELYFDLLESKESSLKLPVFSEYVEWVMSQDPNKLDDRTFVLIAKKLLKTKNKSVAKVFDNFIFNLPGAFTKSIDKMSNEKLNVLVSLLNGMKLDYANLPEECKDFVKELYVACSVREEISRHNKFGFRSMFNSNQEMYFGIMNLAFAGRDRFDSWITDPSKRLQLPLMIKYSNFQSRLLKNGNINWLYEDGRDISSDLGIHYLPDIGTDETNSIYLKKPREYKDYEKKLAPLFKQMIENVLDEIIPEMVEYSMPAILEGLSQLIKTDDAKLGIRSIKAYDEVDTYQKLAIFLGERVGLSSAMQKSSDELFDKNEIESKISDFSEQMLTCDIWTRIENNMCTESDYDELNELLHDDPGNYKIIDAIMMLEEKMIEKD